MLVPTWMVLLIAFEFANIISARQADISPQVETEEGILKGKFRTSRSKRQFMAFEGVRFVEKAERFKVAPPLKKWEGVRDATEEGSPCPQMYIGEASMMGPFGKEDCLFLNVFTPEVANPNKFPVMVFIYGGAFVFGATKEYSPEYFLDQDVVLVMFNYRTGAFGFLYNEDDSIPGNLGMKDQVAALKWVKRNIGHFGGDPNCITIFGESAGGASVHYHMLSPLSKGLFHRAIAQSGSANMPWAFASHPRWNAKRFATDLDCPHTPTSEMVECLKKHPEHDIVDMQMKTMWGPIWSYAWSPVIEVDSGVDDNSAFLRKHPEDLIFSKEIANKVPFMTGLNKNEGSTIFSSMILPDHELVHELNTNWSTISPVLFIYKESLTRHHFQDSAPDKIREFYFGSHPIGDDTEQALTDIFSDRYFIQPLFNSMMALADVIPIYAYLFTFYDGFSIPHMYDYHNLDAPTHADDVYYFFPTMYKMTLKNKREVAFSKHLVALWVDFAKKGKPTDLWGPAMEWSSVNPSDSFFRFYRLDEYTQHIKDPFQQRRKFWDGLEKEARV